MVTAYELLMNDNDEDEFLMVTPLKILSFNATADSSPNDPRNLFSKAVMTGDALEVTGRTGQFQPVIRYKKGFPLNVIRPNSSPNSVEIKYPGTKGIQLLVVYKTGRVRMQGTDYNFLLNKLLDLVGAVRNVKYNNTTGVFGTNLQFTDMYSLPRATFEPEISPFAYVRVQNPKCTLLLTSRGIVHILGASDIQKCYEYAKEYLKKLPPNTFRAGLDIMQPSNAPPVLNKEQGRKGTTCPKDRCPTPYSFSGKCKDGYFVRPNPQGFPCCYQLKRFKKDEVRKAYENAGVNIPNSLKNRVGNVNVPNSPGIKTSYDARGAMKIGTRQCSRYTYQELVVLARKLRIDPKNLKTKQAICDAIQDRYPPAANSPFRPNFQMAGANYALVMKNSKLYINRRVPLKPHQTGTKRGAAGARSGLRECSSIKKEDLLSYARQLGKPLSDRLTKADICKELKKIYANKRS